MRLARALRVGATRSAAAVAAIALGELDEWDSFAWPGSCEHS